MRRVGGSYVSDGAARTLNPLGSGTWKVFWIKTLGSSAEHALFKTTTMATGTGVRWSDIANGDPSVVGQFDSLTATTLVLTAGASNCNVNTVTYVWEAWIDDGDGAIAVGSFTGDGTDNRAIAHGLGSARTVEAIFAAAPWVSTPTCQLHTKDMGATTDVTLSAGGSAATFADAIQQIQKANPNEADFEVGPKCNDSFTTIHFVALELVSTYIESGNYPGNSGTATSFATSAQAGFVTVKGVAAARNAFFKNDAHASAGSSCWSNAISTEQTNRITALGATTISIGTHADVNSGTETFRYLWVRDKPPAAGGTPKAWFGLALEGPMRRVVA